MSCSLDEQLSYISEYEQNIANLRVELEELESKIADLEYELSNAKFDRDELLEVIEDAEDQLIELQNGVCELEDEIF